ncbi:hypothetical protein INT45_002401 [Circinella minor]|uniref:Uncharacterized protein n=1 Tax=Circinella minor TaxID=1195481 RepID=A0A8H7RUZ0_9FUNG|nr:hypothetical protein INT45_002401 [Circinella minor]
MTITETQTPAGKKIKSLAFSPHLLTVYNLLTMWKDRFELAMTCSLFYNIFIHYQTDLPWTCDHESLMQKNKFPKGIAQHVVASDLFLSPSSGSYCIQQLNNQFTALRRLEFKDSESISKNTLKETIKSIIEEKITLVLIVDHADQDRWQRVTRLIEKNRRSKYILFDANHHASTSMNLRKRKQGDGHDGDGAEDDSIGSSKKQKAKDEEEKNNNIELLVRKVLNHKRMDSADKYCLEKYGIICFGENMDTHSCVSSNLRNALPKTNISIAVWKSVQEFIGSIIYSDDYGTPDCTISIFSSNKYNNNNNQNQTTFKMMQRMLYQFPRTRSMYCGHYYALRMIKFLDIPKQMKMQFDVGETRLSAVSNTDNYSWYYADGVGTVVQAGELELLLVEISGAHGNNDTVKHKYDFVKGTFGCCKMVEAIFSKYHYADQDLVEQLSVIYVQASGQDNCLRAWVIRPICKGKFLAFERTLKCEINSNIYDNAATISTLQFFCQLKTVVEQSVKSLQKIKVSHEMYMLTLSENTANHRQSLRNISIPKPPKPNKNDKPSSNNDNDARSS